MLSLQTKINCNGTMNFNATATSRTLSKRNSELNVCASEFISILATPRPSRPSSATPTRLNPGVSEFTLSSSLPSEFGSSSSVPSVPSLSSLSYYKRASAPPSSVSPPSCNIQIWWFENKTLFDDSYDDMRKIFGWSKVPIKKTPKVGELRKLNVEMQRPSKKVKTSLVPIKEETSYAGIVLRNTLRTIRVQN